jgi:hypothetical protein
MALDNEVAENLVKPSSVVFVTLALLDYKQYIRKNKTLSQKLEYQCKQNKNKITKSLIINNKHIKYVLIG